MNCKPGDLAYVIRSDVILMPKFSYEAKKPSTGLMGLIVQVRDLAVGTVWNVEPVWINSDKGWFKVIAVDDSLLKPIRGQPVAERHEKQEA